LLIFSIILYTIGTLAIGFWASKKVKTTADFTLAGKRLSTLLVGVTIFATWFGPELIMGVPGRFVEEGVMGLITDQFGNLLCLILVGFFFAGKLYRKNVITLSDYLRERYNSSLELVSSLIYVYTYFFWIAAQFVALAYLFEAVLGTSIVTGIILGAIIVVIYTYVGGMWAVSLTDLFQSVLIVIGLLILMVSVLDKTNGLMPMLEEKPRSFYAFFPEGGLYVWTDYLAMWMAFGIGALPAQEIYQRIFSAHSEKAAKNGVFLSALLLFIISSVPLVIGLGAATLHPELMGVDHGQNLIPEMVLKYASLPLQILLYGAIISAILSTSSGAMLSPATIIGENLLKPRVKGMTDKQLLLVTRISVVVVAVISCIVAFNNVNIHGLVVSSAVLMLVCLFAPLAFGLYWKKASSTGAWAAILLGGVTWVLCNYLETLVAPTIYGTLASCMGMMAGSMLRPDPFAVHNQVND